MKEAKETVSFIRNFYNRNDFIPLHEPKFGGNEKNYICDTIDSTFVSSVGAYVDKFEGMMASITTAKKAVAVVNGTAGIQVALRLVGVRGGDEVITQALTFVATANAIKYNGAEPVFLDVDYETMGLSHHAVKSFLEDNCEMREGKCFNKKSKKQISACLPMHTFGFPVKIDKIIHICKEWNIPVVEDAAESLGSFYKKKHTGGFGKLGVFSFNGNKIVTSGGGGAIVTNDEVLGENAKYLTTTAKISHPYEYIHDELGYNFRMPNLNAALACGQLEALSSFVDQKRELANKYERFFDELGIKFRKEPENSRANYWLMCVELQNKKDREEFLKYTNQQGVMTRPIWRLMYKLEMYKDCYRDHQKNAEYFEDRIVNITSSVK